LCLRKLIEQSTWTNTRLLCQPSVDLAISAKLTALILSPERRGVYTDNEALQLQTYDFIC